MKDINAFKPIKNFGYCLIIMSACCLILHFFLSNDTDYNTVFMYFIFILSFFHFLVGMGVLLKTKWGYHLFRIYLFLLYPVLPIGTYIAVKTFSYLEKHKIQRYFT